MKIKFSLHVNWSRFRTKWLCISNVAPRLSLPPPELPGYNSVLIKRPGGRPGETLNWIILIGVSVACGASQYALTWRSLQLSEQASLTQIISPWTMFKKYWLKIVLYYFFLNVATKWWRNCSYIGTCTVGAFSKASSSWRHGDWAHLPPGDNFATSS